MHTPEMAEGNVRDLMHELAAMAPNERVPFLARALNSDGSWPGDSATNHVNEVLSSLPSPMCYRMLLQDMPSHWKRFLPRSVQLEKAEPVPVVAVREPLALIAAHFKAFPSPPPSGMDRDGFARFCAGRRASLERLLDELSAQANGLLIPVGNGITYGISVDTRPDGQGWRVTRFDNDMTPMGHDVFQSVRDALIHAVLRFPASLQPQQDIPEASPEHSHF